MLGHVLTTLMHRCSHVALGSMLLIVVLLLEVILMMLLVLLKLLMMLVLLKLLMVLVLLWLSVEMLRRRHHRHTSHTATLRSIIGIVKRKYSVSRSFGRSRSSWRSDWRREITKGVKIIAWKSMRRK